MFGSKLQHKSSQVHLCFVMNLSHITRPIFLVIYGKLHHGDALILPNKNVNLMVVPVVHNHHKKQPDRITCCKLGMLSWVVVISWFILWLLWFSSGIITTHPCFITRYYTNKLSPDTIWSGLIQKAMIFNKWNWILDGQTIKYITYKSTALWKCQPINTIEQKNFQI